MEKLLNNYIKESYNNLGIDKIENIWYNIFRDWKEEIIMLNLVTNSFKFDIEHFEIHDEDIMDYL